MIPFRKRSLLRAFLRMGVGMTGDIQTQLPAVGGGGGPGSFSTVTASSTIGATGVITPLAGIQGVITNSNAAAGIIGQFVTATVAAGAPVSLTSPNVSDVTSISLTAGDWDVSGMINLSLGAATVSSMTGGASLTTGTLPSQAGGAGLGTDALVVDERPTTLLTAVLQLPLPPVRVSLAGTTTLFLVAGVTFAAGTVAAFGTLRARRVR